MRLFILLLLFSGQSFALSQIDTVPSFFGAFDFTNPIVIILSIGASLAVLGALMYALRIGLSLLSGTRVYVEGHGIWDRDVYDAAIENLDSFQRSGGHLDRESWEHVNKRRWRDHNDSDD